MTRSTDTPTLALLPTQTTRVQSSYPAKLPLDASPEARQTHQGRQLRLHKLLLSVLSDAVVVTDHRGAITQMNPAAERLFGRTDAGIDGTSIFSFFPESDRSCLSEEVSCCILSRGDIRDRRVVITRPGGSQIVALLNVNPMFIGQGHLVRVVGVFRDVTELEHKNEQLVKLNEELKSLATTDELTGLPNNRSFRAELARSSRQARRYEESLAVLYLDLNEFKKVNDAYQHQSGDAALCEFGRRLREALYSTDIAARLHGDEFAVILHHTNADGLKCVVEKLVSALMFSMKFLHPLRRTTDTVMIKSSIGGVVRTGKMIPGDDELIRLADQAMYACKQANTFYVLDLDEGVPVPSLFPQS